MGDDQEKDTNQCAAVAMTPRRWHRDPALIDHDHRSASSRMDDVLLGLSALFGEPVRTAVSDAFAGVDTMHDEARERLVDELGEALERLAIAQATNTMLADHLVNLHVEVRQHLAELQGRTKRAHTPQYVTDLEALVERHGVIVTDVMARAAVG